jgi:thiol-disulfide isomerase/thioredoxin
MKHILVIAFLFISFQTIAQDFVREKDRKTGKVLLRGQMKFEDLQDEAAYKWFGEGVSKYEPKEIAIENLKKYHKPYKFIIFLGTWCEDSQIIIPQLYKVLTLAGIDLHSVEMYGVNRDKEALNTESKLYNITRVPAIIVMHQYREVGRITESVTSTIEEDILSIIAPDFQKLEQKRLNRFK